eukprot:1158895-Pelagomonas_calceolata.AAC.11
MKSPCLGGGRRPLCNALGVSVEGQQGRAARRKLAPGHLLHMVRAAGRAARCKLAPGHLCMLMCGDVTPWFHYRGRYMHEAWAAGKGSAPQKLAPGHLCMLNGRRRVSPQGSERGRGRAVRHEGDVSTRHRGAQGVGIGRELWAACHMRDACTGRKGLAFLCRHPYTGILTWDTCRNVRNQHSHTCMCMLHASPEGTRPPTSHPASYEATPLLSHDQLVRDQKGHNMAQRSQRPKKLRHSFTNRSLRMLAVTLLNRRPYPCKPCMRPPTSHPASYEATPLLSHNQLVRDQKGHNMAQRSQRPKKLRHSFTTHLLILCACGWYAPTYIPYFLHGLIAFYEQASSRTS